MKRCVCRREASLVAIVGICARVVIVARGSTTIASTEGPLGTAHVLACIPGVAVLRT